MKQHREALDAKLATVGRKPRDIGILWSVRVQVAELEAEAQAKEKRYLEAIPPQAGLVEMSAQYNVDFSTARPGMRLADFADEVHAQKGNFGSFEELLKTVDPKQTVEEFGRRFLVDRILVASGTPKAIADRFEELHFGPAPMAGSSWVAGSRRWTTSASSSISSSPSCSAAAFRRGSTPVRHCARIQSVTRRLSFCLGCRCSASSVNGVCTATPRTPVTKRG